MSQAYYITMASHERHYVCNDWWLDCVFNSSFIQIAKNTPKLRLNDPLRSESRGFTHRHSGLVMREELTCHDVIILTVIRGDDNIDTGIQASPHKPVHQLPYIAVCNFQSFVHLCANSRNWNKGSIWCDTVYPVKYAYGILYFDLYPLYQHDSWNMLIHILQDCFTGTGAIIWMP